MPPWWQNIFERIFSYVMNCRRIRANPQIMNMIDKSVLFFSPTKTPWGCKLLHFSKLLFKRPSIKYKNNLICNPANIYSCLAMYPFHKDH